MDRYYDESETHFIDILTCEKAPAEPYSTYSTLGLHRVPNVLDDSDIRVEIAGIALSSVMEFPNLLTMAALFVMKNGWICAPGVVFPSLVSEYRLSSTMEHVMWATPSPWKGLSSVQINNDLTVHWLLAVPISESERQFLVGKGYDEFEKLLSETEVDFSDLDRLPVV